MDKKETSEGDKAQKLDKSQGAWILGICFPLEIPPQSWASEEESRDVTQVKGYLLGVYMYVDGCVYVCRRAWGT